MKLESEKGHSSVWACEEQSNSPSDTNSIAFSTVETESSEEVWGFTPVSTLHSVQLNPIPGKNKSIAFRDVINAGEPSEVLDTPSELCEARKEGKLMKAMNRRKMQILRSTKVSNQIRIGLLKEICIHGNSLCQALQQTKECKLMKVMNRRKMQICQSMKV
jgi:hypothetical protein